MTEPMKEMAKRTCPFCVEPIKADAKLCPHCRQWLTMKSYRHPLINLLVVGIPMALLFTIGGLAVFSRLDQLTNPKPYYSELPDSLQILKSHMNWTAVHDELRIYIAGVLTNTSPITWRDPEVDCRFFDAKGDMIDAATGFGHVSVRPNDDSAFRVSITPTAPTNSYASFKVSISHARNARGWY